MAGSTDSGALKKQKIVVLGGGVGALSAVYEITDQPGWNDKYDITVYQMGWRLGGKGASGRNQSNNERIEEHGFHVWFGFYQNAFNVMWRCYEELGRSPNAPLATVQTAFQGIDDYDFIEQVNGKLIPWEIDFPHDDHVFPGDPKHLSEFPSLWQYLELLLDYLHERFHNSSLFYATAFHPSETHSTPPHWWQRLISKTEQEIETIGASIEVSFLNHALLLVKSLSDDVSKHGPEDHKIISGLLKEFKKWLNNAMDKLSLDHDEIRRLWIVLDTGLTVAIGMLEDGVFTHGLNILNRYEFTEWLYKHDISDITANSAPIRAVYDAAFAYENGDTTKRNMCAGVYLRAMFRILFSYKGHVLYKMNAGMGDTIFAPIYEVLERRGVQFKFFYKVTLIEPDNPAGKISKIHLARQVDLYGECYQPLFMVNDLPCWPSEPFYEQIRQGDELRQRKINLESYWTDWEDVGTEILSAENSDFDLVILGISIKALETICKPIIDTQPRWQDMMTYIKTVQTQGVQLWMNRTALAEGYGAPNGILGAYLEPYASWVDFSQLISRENFPESANVQSILYSCGVMQDDGVIPPPSEHAYPAKELQKAKDIALDLLKNNSTYLFSQASTGGQLDWNVLVDMQNRVGEQRFNAQYSRANIDPTERYDLSVKGSDVYRLKANESGYSNMIFAGTWINNGFNLGAVEAGVMAGMQASRAITGYPTTIIGEGDILDD